MSIPVFSQEVKKFDLGNEIEVLILEMPFSKNHSVSGCPDYPKSACLINGQTPFGTDLNIPSYELTYIKIRVAEKVYSLDVTNMFDAWGNRAIKHKGSKPYFSVTCQDELNCDVQGRFSDGAGSFIAEWEIRLGDTKRTLIEKR